MKAIINQEYTADSIIVTYEDASIVKFVKETAPVVVPDFEIPVGKTVHIVAKAV